MFVNQFERFSHLIQFELQEKARAIPSPTEEYYEATIAMLTKDAKAIALKINSIKIIHPTLKKAEWRVRAYQDEIITLMDSLTYMMEEMDLPQQTDSPISGSWHELFLQIQIILSEGLDFIQIRHPDLFYNNIDMPIYLEKSHRAKWRDKLDELRELVPESSESCTILKWLDLPLKRDDRPLTFVQYSYLQKIFDDLTEIIQAGHPDKTTACRLRNHLCIMDFNHPKFIEDCIQDLQLNLIPGSSKSFIKQYLNLKRQVSPIKHRERVGLFEELPSVKELLMDFLNNEISIHKALIETESIISQNEWKDFKVMTSLSCLQLAGILRILWDKGLIINAEKEQFLQFFAFHFKAEGGKDATLDGLLKHFEQSGEKALKQLKELFN